MSPLALPSSASAALPAVNFHPHGHGHKKGLPSDSPVGSTQNLFSSLFDSLAQAIGARPAQNAQAAQVAQAAQPAESAPAAQLAIGSKINTTA